MALKFDGKCLKESSKILCNVRGNTIFEESGGSKPLANVRGDTIFEGSGGSKPLIKTSDAARKIGAKAGLVGGHLISAMWYKFCR